MAVTKEYESTKDKIPRASLLRRPFSLVSVPVSLPTQLFSTGLAVINICEEIINVFVSGR